MTRPTDLGAWPPIGQLLRRGAEALLAGDVREADRVLRAAIARRPFHPVAHFNLAVVCRLRGDLPRALGHARLAVELAGSAPAHVLYGVHLQLAGARDRARQHFERALEIAPNYRLAAMYLALVHREVGSRADAIAGLERALVLGSGALPPLIAERVRGQLFDLRRGLGPDVPTPTALCSVAVVTEILHHDGTTALPDAGPVKAQADPPRAVADAAPGAEGATALPAPARTCDAAEIAGLIHGASKIVVLTGAGASTASGLSTRKQLWQRYDRDAAVSAIGVAHNPAVLWAVVRDFLGLQDHPPGAVHHVIARLPRVTAIVTQNVDDLHQRAALPGRETPVFELHGTLERMRCPACGVPAPHPARDYVRDHLSPPPCAACQGPVRPDVVLFGEQLAPSVLAASLRAVEDCDLLLVVGCSMDVAPASELPCIAAAHGATIIELKRSPSRISEAVGSALLLGPAEETLLAVYARLAELEELPPLPPLHPANPSAPVTTPFVLPSLGDSIAEVTLSCWRRQVGDIVAAGDIIAEFDTDTMTIEIEAPFSGIVRALRIEPFAIVRSGEPIADVEPLAVSVGARGVSQAFVPLPPHRAHPSAHLTTPFVLPPLGESIFECTLARWTRQVGDTVAPGDIIAEFDTDKVTVEIEAPFGGILRALRIEPSATVRIGEPIADVEPLAVPAAPREVREAFDSLFTNFGPHTAVIRRGIDALGDARWLRPAESATELEAQVRVLASAHSLALGLKAPLQAWFTGDPREAFAHWRSAWRLTDVAKPPSFDPVTRAWHAAVKAALSTPALANPGAFAPSGPLSKLVDARVAFRMRELHGEASSWRRTRAEGLIKSLVRYHLMGLAARGQDVDPPCPFAPLAAIWAAGAWPFVLPGGVMGVYLPYRDDDAPPESLPGTRYAFYLFTGLGALPF